MTMTSRWKVRAGWCALVFGLSALVLPVANAAPAGCGLYKPVVPSVQQGLLMRGGAGSVNALNSPDSGHFLRVSNEIGGDTAIVGMWQVTFISDGVAPNAVPAGVMIDFGTVQWHGDGTEFMISGGRPPSTGDVCMGVWKQIGPFTYKLHHIGLSWVSPDTPPSAGGPGPSPAEFLGQAIISEVVTLDRTRTKYLGHFTIDQYNAEGTTVLVHLSGTVNGTRVTVD